MPNLFPQWLGYCDNSQERNNGELVAVQNNSVLSDSSRSALARFDECFETARASRATAPPPQATAPPPQSSPPAALPQLLSTSEHRPVSFLKI